MIIMWVKVAFGFLAGGAKKISVKTLLVLVSVLAGSYLVWSSKNYLEDLRLSVTDLTSENKVLVAQTEKVLAVNESSAQAFSDYKKDIMLSDAITQELIDKVEGIQNVKITEKTIIQTAQGSCLDRPYPDSILSSGVLRWEQEDTPSKDSD